MVLWGAIVNAAAIAAGTFAGLLLPRLHANLRTIATQGMGLALCVLGLTMALKSEQYLAMVVSLVIGGIAGELLRLEGRLERLGEWLESKVAVRGEGKVGKAFVTATLVYCIGAMAILGSIDSGIRHDHTILYAKSLMDGFLSILFASALGVGVAFSAIPVLVYQGAIALLAALLASLFSAEAIAQMTQEISAVGGVLIIGVGINLLEIKKIGVAAMLPSVVIMAAIMAVMRLMH
ncbi:DUF554 domain-containing protein [Paenibacillus ginsengarvi]|uniref:DUF554 domain-containing protein n=1 Tax=Paenibacillus ginsengarvi TaxID=400777 RepID=A0A3B0BX24_9BACL|nr:DUF554 domain-containing protein [Paenibacillus ginsengarvi]RKN75996.1 DUF554 domain-containing protein [Paenibacillus ginsengarvi]